MSGHTSTCCPGLLKSGTVGGSPAKIPSRKRCSDSAENQSTAFGSQILPETGLEWPVPCGVPCGASQKRDAHRRACAWAKEQVPRLAAARCPDSPPTRASFKPLLPCGQQSDKSLLPSCLGARCPYSPGKPSDFKVSLSIRQLAAQTLVVQFLCWLHGVPIHQQRTPRLYQWACVLHDQAAAPAVDSG